MRKLHLLLLLATLLFSGCGDREPNITYQGLRMAQISSNHIQLGMQVAAYSHVIDSIMPADSSQFTFCHSIRLSRSKRMHTDGSEISFTSTLENIPPIKNFTLTNLGGDRYRIYGASETTADTMDLTLTMNVSGKGTTFDFSGVDGFISIGGLRTEIATPAALNISIYGAYQIGQWGDYQEEHYDYAPASGRSSMNADGARQARTSPAPHNVEWVSFVSGTTNLTATSGRGEVKTARAAYIGCGSVRIENNGDIHNWPLSDIHLHYDSFIPYYR